MAPRLNGPVSSWWGSPVAGVDLVAPRMQRRRIGNCLSQRPIRHRPSHLPPRRTLSGAWIRCSGVIDFNRLLDCLSWRASGLRARMVLVEPRRVQGITRQLLTVKRQLWENDNQLVHILTRLIMKVELGGGCAVIPFDFNVDWVGGFRGWFVSDRPGSMLLFRLAIPKFRSGILSSVRASQHAWKAQGRPGHVNVAIMTGLPSGIL